MSQIYVSQTERPVEIFHKIGIPCTLPEKFGSDFLLSAPNLTIGIQRKRFPSDLLSSLPPSNRLAIQIQLMETLTHKLIILEGRPKYTSDGGLMMKQYSHSPSRHTRGTINSILISLQCTYNIPIIWSEDETDTLDIINRFFTWGQKASHGSLTKITGQKNNSPIKSYQLSILQQFPGIGLKTANDILSHCGGLPLICSRNISEVVGVGKRIESDFRSILEYKEGM